MTARPAPRPYHLSPRRRELVAIATAEQARVVDWLHARVKTERDHVQRHILIGRRDDINLAWGEIIWWLTDDVAPDGLAAALQIAERAARKAREQWDKANGCLAGHPQAAHWQGLILIDRMLQARFRPAPEGLAA